MDFIRKNIDFNIRRMKNLDKLIHSNSKLSSLLFRMICSFQNSELPNRKNIGKNIKFPHGLKNIVMHEKTRIEDNVTVFHEVTCGRGDMYGIVPDAPPSKFEGIVLKEGAVLCAGAKVICNRGLLTVGRNTIVGANAVLTRSTGDNEIWAGKPARLIKKRNHED